MQCDLLHSGFRKHSKQATSMKIHFDAIHYLFWMVMVSYQQLTVIDGIQLIERKILFEGCLIFACVCFREVLDHMVLKSWGEHIFSRFLHKRYGVEFFSIWILIRSISMNTQNVVGSSTSFCTPWAKLMLVDDRLELSWSLCHPSTDSFI